MVSLKARVKFRFFLFVLLVFLFLFPGDIDMWGQSTIGEVVPMGFQNIRLGDSVDNVKALLKKSVYFYYRGDPDVSFLPETEQTLIEVAGRHYIKRGYFQFKNGKLIVIIIELNRNNLDYYTMYTTLKNKYGKPSSISPSEAVWDFKDVRLSLEKPLSVKYMVVQKEEGGLGKSKSLSREYETEALKEFLNQF